jgi:dienelactone hydrolase
VKTTILRCVALAMAALLVGVGVRADDPPAKKPKVETIDDLWAGFDPHALPLDVEVVKSWDEGDVHLEMMYFTGEEFEGQKTRVFGYLGRPKKVEGKIPGVLHVHGGGQTAVLDWPRFWAKRGYACLSFDFCGNTNLPELGPGYKREHYTRWGKVPADMMKIGAGTQMTPTPRHNPWFHWTLAARRGLTLLETRPEVDKEKLGVFGVSVGGTLTWSIASVDARVKAAAPIYGCGWEFYQYPPDPTGPVDDNLKQWRKLIAPEAHAPRVKCPLLYLSATNDGHGRMDLAFRTLDSLGSQVRSQVFTPNYDHHVEPAEAKSLPLFMDCHLKGTPEKWSATPKVELAAGAAGVPEMRVTPADVEQVERVDAYYCLSNDWPTTRFWRTAGDAKREKDVFTVAVPFLNKTDVFFAFANVTYKSGVRISSRLVKQAATDIPGAKPTLQREALIDAMDTSTDWNWVPAYTDPCRDDRFFAEWKGPNGERGFTLDPKTFRYGGAMHYYFGTRKIGDPQFQGTGRKTLLLDYPAANAPEKLTVRLTNRIPPQNPVEFTAVVALPEKGEGAWRTIRMEAGQFKDAGGKALSNWDHVEFFVLNGTNPANKPPVFKRLRWAE